MGKNRFYILVRKVEKTCGDAYRSSARCESVGAVIVRHEQADLVGNCGVFLFCLSVNGIKKRLDSVEDCGVFDFFALVLPAEDGFADG